MLTCHYTGVVNASSLVVLWKFQAARQTTNIAIWTYNGPQNNDGWYDNHGEIFAKVKTDITKEHAIILKGATLTDQGMYSCMVEYYKHGEFVDDKGYLEVVVNGM